MDEPAEAQIRRYVEDWGDALRARDVSARTENYAQEASRPSGFRRLSPRGR